MRTHLYPCGAIVVAQCGPCERPFTYGGAVILAEWDGQAAHVCPSCARLHGGRTGREHAEAAGNALHTLAAIQGAQARAARERQHDLADRDATERKRFRPRSFETDPRTGGYREVRRR